MTHCAVVSKLTFMLPVVAFLGATLPASAIDNAERQAAAPFGIELQSLAPPIVSREHWRARLALPGMQPQSIKGIVLHHTAARKNPRLSLEDKIRGLQTFSQRPGQVSPSHQKPAWGDVPYHFYVDVAGRVAEGRELRFSGDTNTNYDTSGYIQIAVEGDFDKEMPEPAQLSSVRDLVAWLSLSWDVPANMIGVHNALAATRCPGVNFMAALPPLLAQVAERRKEMVEAACARLSTAEASEACRPSP